MSEARKAGRPTIRSEILADTIEDGISAGQTLSELSRIHGFSRKAYYDWLDEDQDFASRIARARLRGFDVMAEECKAIAEDGTNDYMMTEHGPRLDTEHVQRSKLRIWTRLELLKKWDPRRYGDKVQHADANGDKLPETAFIINGVQAKPPEDD